MTRVHAHPTGEEVKDVFGGTSTVSFDFGSPIADSKGRVTFDPKRPILTKYNDQTLENGYDPNNTGSATTRLDMSNVRGLASILAPMTHITYHVSPQGETLHAVTGLDWTTVHVQDGNWTVLQGFDRLELPGFDNRWERSSMFFGTSMSTPGPVVGQG